MHVGKNTKFRYLDHWDKGLKNLMQLILLSTSNIDVLTRGNFCFRFDVFEVFEGESEVDIELAANMWEDFLPSELTAVSV